MIRVVIADDHPLVRSGLTGLLTAEGDVEVVATAGNGDDVVAAVAEHDPDVVLMDLSMPGTGGIEATRRIAAGGSHAHVVVLTSFGDRERILGRSRAARSASCSRTPSRRRSCAPSAPPPAATLRSIRGPREGLPNKRIAQRLGISERTVKAHLTRIYEALGVSDRTTAALWARDHGV